MAETSQSLSQAFTVPCTIYIDGSYKMASCGMFLFHCCAVGSGIITEAPQAAIPTIAATATVRANALWKEKYSTPCGPKPTVLRSVGRSALRQVKWRIVENKFLGKIETNKSSTRPSCSSVICLWGAIFVVLYFGWGQRWFSRFYFNSFFRLGITFNFKIDAD